MYYWHLILWNPEGKQRITDLKNNTMMFQRKNDNQYTW